MSDGILWGFLPLSVLTWAVQMIVYHGVGLAFEICDRTGHLSWARVRNVGRLRYRELLPRVLFNQIFILLPAMAALQWMGLAFTGVTHLSLLAFFGGMFLMGLGHDVVQYVFHRHLLHRPGFVRRLKHSVHHSTGASQAISACYMSPADFALEITLPYLVPLALIGGGGADVTFHLLIAGLGAVGGLYEHSGYDFAVSFRQTRLFARAPGLGNAIATLISSHAHAEHHRRNNVSFSDGFGSPGLCDTLFNTRWDKVKSGGVPRSDPAGSML